MRYGEVVYWICGGLIVLVVRTLDIEVRGTIVIVSIREDENELPQATII